MSILPKDQIPMKMSVRIDLSDFDDQGINAISQKPEICLFCQYTFIAQTLLK